MRSLPALLTILLFSVFLFSCKKSNSSTSGGGGGSVQGNWKFLYLTAQTQGTATVSGVTDITKSTYTTTDNSGTFSFTADSVVVTNLTYTANFSAEAYTYLGSTLLDSLSEPLSETIPATNESTAYKQIGNDSLYFPSGGFSAGGSMGTTIASGARYVISNDTLKINQQLNITEQGIAYTGSETIYLLKQ
jgi:hypothetical protein